MRNLPLRSLSTHSQHGEITMALMKTSNPALGANTFSNISDAQYGGSLIDAADRMTLNGTVNKTGVLLVCFATSLPGAS